MEARPIEFMLAGWSQNHTSGNKVTFWCSDEDFEYFKDKTAKHGKTAGQRFMAALVEIGDDEQPVDRDKPRRPLLMSSVMLCKDANFQQFAVLRAPVGTTGDAEETAAACIRSFCNVETRSKLDDSEESRQSFSRLMQIFREWCVANDIDTRRDA